MLVCMQHTPAVRSYQVWRAEMTNDYSGTRGTQLSPSIDCGLRIRVSQDVRGSRTERGSDA